MSAPPHSQNRRPAVWAFGPLPPPVNGQTLLTQKVVERLKQATPLTFANWAAGDARPRPHTSAIRVLRTAACLAKLIRHGRVRNTRLYITSNSRGGLVMTGLLIRAGRRLGYSIFLHHHTYNYIDNYDSRMAWIDRGMGADDVHIMHCPRMIENFRAQYQSKCRFEILFPSVVSLPLSQPRLRVPDSFSLGFLANLTVPKGLDLVLETFRSLNERRSNVRLCLAGPFGSAEAETIVNQALQQYKGRISHVGAVYGQSKLEFFNSIDCFLFPSRSESWGIVLNEALAAGVPVIATNRGCVKALVGDRAGLVIAEEQRYVSEAVRQVEAWIDSPQDYFAASRAAIERAAYLHQEAAMQLEQLTASICSPTKSA